MIKICVKSGIKQLPLFENERFPYYEAFIGCDDVLSDLLNTHMELVSIHMPETIKINSKVFAINFNKSSEIATASYNKLNEIIEFSKTNDVKNIILHLGFFNSFTEDRYNIIDMIIDRFRLLDAGKVKLLIENVPCWINISFENEPIISNVEHMLYFIEKCPEAGIVFDIDHVAINTIFQRYYPGYKQKYIETENKSLFRMELEKKIINETSKNIDYYSSIVNCDIINFLTVIKPNVIHATGSDFCNYQPYYNLPLNGESIPMGFRGRINGKSVEDRINHKRWIEKLPDNGKDIYITLELALRNNDYNYIEQIKKNWFYLNKTITEVSRHSNKISI
jgi:hypothetical protein